MLWKNHLALCIYVSSTYSKPDVTVKGKWGLLGYLLFDGWKTPSEAVVMLRMDQPWLHLL